MAEFQYKAGLNSVGNYQVSGIPYVTGNLTVNANTQTPTQITFPSVTQRVHIHNNDTTNGVRVGFSALGVSGSNASKYWLVEAHTPSGKNNDYIELRVKTDKLFLLSNTTSAVTGVYIAAELTGIELNYSLADAYSGSNGIG
jgi:hypothetical protein